MKKLNLEIQGCSECPYCLLVNKEKFLCKKNEMVFFNNIERIPDQCKLSSVFNSNLENPEILSSELKEAIFKLVELDNNIVFGGSLVLNAVGLLQRKVNDIDVFLPKQYSLCHVLPSFENYSESFTSDTVTDMNGVEIQRTGIKSGNVHICFFKVDDIELQHSKFILAGKEIKLQNVNIVLAAKEIYSRKNIKHLKDLTGAKNIIDNIIDDLPF